MKVIVIGGGPAGSLAAVLLSRGGVQVTLIEQHRFPRDKVCGECLSALGRAVLGRHDLEGDLLSIGRELRSANVFGRTQTVSMELPQPMLGISRAALDASLLTAARAAGADIQQPARVEAVGQRPSLADVTVRNLTTNAVEILSADFVLIADGRAAFGEPRPPLTGDLGVKAHFADVAADASAITLYGGLDCYGGVAPIEGERWNVAFSVPKATASQFKGDFDAWWSSLLQRSSVLAKHFAAARRLTPWLASPLPRHGVPLAWPERLIPIGASACAIEPVGGEGMGTALRSAELAVHAILHDRVGTLPAAYAELWTTRSVFCRLGGQALADEQWSDAVALTGSRAVQRTALWLVGK